MPKLAKSLSAIEVQRLIEPGHWSVGGVAGLALQVTPTGARSWVLRIKIGNTRHDIGLGAFPGVSLAQARQKAGELRQQIAEGRNPVQERTAAKARIRAEQAATLTFAEASERFIKAKSPEWKNTKSPAQWRASLETYAYPVIGNLDIRLIAQQHVEAILEPIWTTKTETATRLRGRIENVLDWAAAGGFRQGDNPARWRGLLDKRLPNPTKLKKVEHFPAVPLDEVFAFSEDLRAMHGTAARALEFAMLTAARSGEVRGAVWSEIDLKTAVWTVPAARMKAGKEHRVPLSMQALDLLRALPQVEGSEHVFTAPRGGALSDMSLTAVMRRMGRSEVPHGLRSSFRDWASERTAYPHEVAEMALAHTVKGVEASYRRLDMIDHRRSMMQAWADFTQTQPTTTADVVPIRREAA